MAQMIQVTSKREGFRRCGVAFSTKATNFPMDRFNDGQLKILKDDPMLVVQTVDVTEPKGKKEKKKDPDGGEQQ